MLIASLVLHQAEEVGAVTQKEVNSEYRTLAYIGIILTILGLVMVFISDVQNCIPIVDMQNSRQHTFIENYRHTNS